MSGQKKLTLHPGTGSDTARGPACIAGTLMWGIITNSLPEVCEFRCASVVFHFVPARVGSTIGPCRFVAARPPLRELYG